MSERLDAEVTLGDGGFPLMARAEGNQGSAMAIAGTSAATGAPAPTVELRELAVSAVLATQLSAAPQAPIPAKPRRQPRRSS